MAKAHTHPVLWFILVILNPNIHFNFHLHLHPTHHIYARKQYDPNLVVTNTSLSRLCILTNCNISISNWIWKSFIYHFSVGFVLWKNKPIYILFISFVLLVFGFALAAWSFCIALKNSLACMRIENWLLHTLWYRFTA